MNQAQPSHSSLLHWLLSPANRHVVPDTRELMALEYEAQKDEFRSSRASLRFVTQPQVARFSPEYAGNLPAVRQPAADLDTGHATESAPGIDSRFGQTVVLIVDQRITMRFGSWEKTKSIVAARSAAFLAWRALAQNTRVGAIIFNDQRWVYLQPQCSRLRVRSILYALQQDPKLGMVGSVKSNLGMLNVVLRHTELFTGGNYLIILITDSSGCDEETLRLVNNLSCDNRFVIALAYDPCQVDDGGWFCEKFSRKAESRSHQSPPAEAGNRPFDGRALLGRGVLLSKIPIVGLNTHQNDDTNQLHRLWRRATRK